MALTRVLHRAGNGAAIRLPKPLLELLDLEPGSKVRLSLVGRQLVLEKEPDSAGQEPTRPDVARQRLT